MNLRRLILIAAALVVVVIAGCGSSSSSSSSTPNQGAPNPNAAEVNPAGDIPDNQAYVPYSPPQSQFSVTVPEGWSQTSSGGAVTFTDKLNSIRIEQSPASSAPTAASVKSNVVPMLAKSVQGFSNPQVSTVQRSAGSAVLVTYLAQAKPDPVTGKTGTDAVEQYTFFHKGQDVTLTLTGPQGADNVDPWMTVTDSLKWTA